MNSRSYLLSTLRRISFFCLTCLCSSAALGQHHAASALFKPEALPQNSLALHLPDSLHADTAQAHTISMKSPTTAVLLSAVLPGAGQVYTGRYWKVPLILGVGGYFASVWVRQNNLYVDARTQYQQSVDAKENNGQGNPQLLSARDFYHDQRDQFAFYLAITYLLNLVDAYVDASLYNFDVGDNLGGGTSVKISVPIR
jgi:hypothetical protein